MKYHMVEAWLYRKVGEEILFLLLKRREEKGGFWQPVVGKIEPQDSDEQDAAQREIEEETAIPRTKLKCSYTNVHEFTIDKHYLTNNPISPVHEVVLAFESSCFTCTIDKNNDCEHDSYGWFTFEEAMKLLKWQDNKNALQKLHRLLH